MEDLGIKFNPVNKIMLFREVKNVIFLLMDKNDITAARAEEIFEYVKKYVINIETPERAKQFYTHLGDKFEELKIIKYKFEIKEEEKIDLVFSLLLNEFMEGGNMYLADEIMNQMNEQKDSQDFLKKLMAKYPIESKKALENFSG